jgi:hypothetical protein
MGRAKKNDEPRKRDVPKTSRSTTWLPWLITISVVSVIGVLFWLDAYWITQFAWEGRKLLRWLELLLLFGVCIAIPAVLGGERLGVAAGWAGAIFGSAAVVLLMLWSGYQNDRGYVTQASVVTDPVPALAPRAPYLVGAAQAGTSLGDITGDVSDTTYLPDQDRFSTLVVRRGWLSGYQAGFTQKVPLSGRGDTGLRCDFDTALAGARIGGRFGHNLGRLIAQHRLWVRYDSKDVYGYCDGTTPKVVVPLKRQVGWFGITERPAGVALYNGRTGELTLTEDTAGIPGPTYPISLAAAQREALTAHGSFSDWLARRGGWVASDDGANEGNDSEFSLDRVDRSGPAYVTPLTPHGTTSSIVAVSMIPTQHSGHFLAPMTVHRLARAWVSPEAVAERIRSDYRDACCYNDDRVFEVIPTGGDSWVATMGSEQNLTYRVRGNGQLQGPEATCLESADGQPIRCGNVRAQTKTTVPEGKDITTLTNDDLLALQRKVADELARRLKGG